MQAQPILQKALPDDMVHTRKLPGILPVQDGLWMLDDVYAEQMALRRDLITHNSDAVHALLPVAHDAAVELLKAACEALPNLGFQVGSNAVCGPDGVEVALDRDNPLRTLGRVLQQDFCILQTGDDGMHDLTGAVLCFPASWTLNEKIGRSVVRVHRPVSEYDDAMARRVQRLFDGVQVERPVWRFNRLWYLSADLFQPRSESAPRDVVHHAEDAPFLRTERQTLFRLPKTRAVIFMIHTYVMARADAPADLS